MTGDDPRPCMSDGRGPDAFGYGCGVMVCCAITDASELDVDTGFCPFGRSADVGVIAGTVEPLFHLLCDTLGRIAVDA